MVRKEVLDWLNSAEDDLNTAETLYREKIYYASAFYCQQAAEKALKAAFINEFKKSIQSHNLVEISRELKAPEEIISACRKLNPHYVQTRYPEAANAIPADVYDDEIVEELLEEAKKVFEWSETKTSK
ncbi:HEPN domain-containing protein [archaeon]|nr:HEPN domain-containing protein [archaeon]